MMLSPWMRRIALTSHILLILLVVSRGFSPISILLGLILLLPLPGMFKGRTYTFAWASMMVAFYVAGFLAEGYANPDAKTAAFIVASVAALDYVSLMLFVRFLAREKAAHARPESSAQTEESDGAAP
tara:strand:- start:185 stop:565 length:381 start_codon:yes stop_codon:yes gene_type:complete